MQSNRMENVLERLIVSGQLSTTEAGAIMQVVSHAHRTRPHEIGSRMIVIDCLMMAEKQDRVLLTKAVEQGMAR
jgi:hypothetical protein